MCCTHVRTCGGVGGYVSHAPALCLRFSRIQQQRARVVPAPASALSGAPVKSRRFQRSQELGFFTVLPRGPPAGVDTVRPRRPHAPGQQPQRLISVPCGPGGLGAQWVCSSACLLPHRTQKGKRVQGVQIRLWQSPHPRTGLCIGLCVQTVMLWRGSQHVAGLPK